MGQWSSKMSNAAMSYPRDTWYTVYLWGLSAPSQTVSDDKDGIRETAGHSFYVKGFSYLWPQPHFLRCWAGQLHGLVIKTFLSTFRVKIISLDELNINWWSQIRALIHWLHKSHSSECIWAFHELTLFIITLFIKKCDYRLGCVRI